MKKVFFAMAMAFGLTGAASANPYDYKVIRVIDGDTVVVEAPWIPIELKQEISIRILGIDTPEKGGRAQCAKEAKLGADATAFAKTVIKPGQIVQVNLIQWDKFGGRVNATISVNGEDFAQMQIDRGLARPYNGEKKKSWCE